MTDSDSARLREHPDTRFVGGEHRVDLRRAADELRREPKQVGVGHRQRSLYKQGRVTIALFAFDAGGSLPDHVAKGVVTINVLEGRMSVRAQEREHTLAAGNLLILASGVRHDLHAHDPSTMLLQVHLDEAAIRD